MGGHTSGTRSLPNFDDRSRRLRAMKSEALRPLALLNVSTKGLEQSKLPVFLRVMLFWGYYMAILILEWKVKTKIPPQWGQLFWGLASSAALLLLTFVFLRWEGRTFRDVGLNLERMSVPRLVSGIAIGLASFATILLLINIVAGPMRLTRGTASSGSTVISGCSILALACMEELGFRAYPLRTLVRTLGMWQAQAIVVVAFALCHVAYGWSWVNIVLGVMPWALVFGMAATSSRGLAMSLGVHAGINFAQSAVNDNSGIWKLVFNEQLRTRIGLASRIVNIAVTMFVAFLFWRLQVHRNRGDAASIASE